ADERPAIAELGRRPQSLGAEPSSGASDRARCDEEGPDRPRLYRHRGQGTMSMAVADDHAEQARDDRAHALMQSALALIPQGSWPEAAAALEEAAMLHAQASRSYDQARCLQLAATLRRSAGQTSKSR